MTSRSGIDDKTFDFNINKSSLSSVEKDKISFGMNEKFATNNSSKE